MAGKPAVEVEDRPVAAALPAGLTSAEARRRLASGLFGKQQKNPT
jgi:hypothetical protein